MIFDDISKVIWDAEKQVSVRELSRRIGLHHDKIMQPFLPYKSWDTKYAWKRGRKEGTSLETGKECNARNAHG